MLRSVPYYIGVLIFLAALYYGGKWAAFGILGAACVYHVYYRIKHGHWMDSVD